ncbi:unnamed protein product [Clonostachys rosea]|uniref:Uncharacterized protein n=1 Tax=Bionectria ochroleuca TaxID=29856 RepID=A0ABY6UWZ9_BIOOC|nr:unnamed protein product [Clonostachys rosea]
MKPVYPRHVKHLLAEKSTLIFNKSRVGLGFIERFVHRSPELVTTKQGHKKLPLELWDLIFKFATSDFRGDECYLVLPKRLHVFNQDEVVIVCERVQPFDPVGDLWSFCHILDMACIRQTSKHDKGGKRTLTDRQARTGATIMVNIQRPRKPPSIQILFSRITIPDVIARVQGGECDVCSGYRYICSSCEKGVPGTHWVCNTYEECGAIHPCPRCIGYYTLFNDDSVYSGYKNSEAMGDKGYVNWTMGRMRRLGYS